MHPSDFDRDPLPSEQEEQQEPPAADRADLAAEQDDRFDPLASEPIEEHPEDPDAPTYSVFPPPLVSQHAVASSGATRRPPWWQAARAAALIAILLVGLGIGLIAANAHASQAKNNPSATSAATVTTSSSSVSLPATVQDLQQTIIAVTKQVQASVVEVTSVGSNSEAIGSGEFLTSNGYIVTNAHVVDGYSSYTVTLANGTTKSAQLVGEDTQDDLAVLKVNVTNATPISFADSSQEQVGEFVVAIGSPLGLQESATFGIVSALSRTEQEQSSSSSTSAGAVLTGLIQTSAQINPGNSGGALVNLDGQLVGITTLSATSTSGGESVSGIGFAIPSNRVKTVVNELIQSGHLTSTGQGYLGIQGQDVTAQSGASVQQGVAVEGFAQDTAGSSPAQAAGMQSGDIITAVNGQAVTDSLDLAGIVYNLAPGTTVSVTVERGSSQITLNVTLGERPISS
jgi:S1-C subfamily serine protease